MNNFLLIIKAIFIGITTGFIISMPLGPSGLESIKRTVSHSFKEGFKVSIGAIFADVSYIFFINFGLLRLLSRNKFTESLFWVISGFLLVLIGLESLKKIPSFLPKLNLSGNSSLPFVSGFLITFTNPMTLSLWLFVSGTVMRPWYALGSGFYYTFIFCMVVGMVLWFTLLNFLALKGFNFLPSSASSKTEFLLKYSIIVIGIGFFIFGIGRIIIHLIR